MTLPSVFRFQRGRELPALRFATHPGAPLVDEVNRIVEDFFRDAAPGAWPAADAFAPSLAIEETDDEVKVFAELPGIDEKDVDLSLEDGVLTLRGEKRAESSGEKAGWSRSERSYGRFERRVALPCEVVAEKASAAYKKGVLTVTLPKAAEARAKSVAIPIQGE